MVAEEDFREVVSGEAAGVHSSDRYTTVICLQVRSLVNFVSFVVPAFAIH